MSLEDILAGPPVKKILFMAKKEAIEGTVLPHFKQVLVGTAADWTQAVDTMFEIVPRGAFVSAAHYQRAADWHRLFGERGSLSLDAAISMHIGEASVFAQKVRACMWLLGSRAD
jgi:hypothetical protein